VRTCGEEEEEEEEEVMLKYVDGMMSMLGMCLEIAARVMLGVESRRGVKGMVVVLAWEQCVCRLYGMVEFSDIFLQEQTDLSPLPCTKGLLIRYVYLLSLCFSK